MSSSLQPGVRTLPNKKHVRRRIINILIMRSAIWRDYYEFWRKTDMKQPYADSVIFWPTQSIKRRRIASNTFIARPDRERQTQSAHRNRLSCVASQTQDAVCLLAVQPYLRLSPTAVFSRRRLTSSRVRSRVAYASHRRIAREPQPVWKTSTQGRNFLVKDAR